MNDRTDFSDVRRRLQPGDVFHRANHDWKTQSDHRWKGSCPWHDSSSGTCFTVNPETLTIRAATEKTAAGRAATGARSATRRREKRRGDPEGLKALPQTRRAAPVRHRGGSLNPTRGAK